MSALDPEAPLERGTVVGRYVVLHELGAGGMGVVYAAYDPELDRKVALKLLHASAGGSPHTGGHRRLVREAQAMAKLSHPNVITVHDVGEHQGRVFVAMEFVEGETLGTWLEQDRAWTEVLDVLVRAGRGLAAAHEKDLVHRDFKPDNVMIGADGRVRVMDFGLARPTTSVHPEASQPEGVAESKHDLGSDLTKVGSIMGTPAYMAPEQHLGLETDARTDQFSFCVTLWEGLYGERPFGGETVAALALNVAEGKLRNVPSGTKVPRWLRPILMRGLASDPADRFAALGAVLGALERGAARRRRRIAIAGAGALVAAGLAAFGGWQLDVQGRRLGCVEGGMAVSELWNPAAKTRLREALVATGVPSAEAAFEHSVPFFDRYAKKWQELSTDQCFVAEVHRTLDPELWATSRRCLDERRGELRALIEVLSEPADVTSVHQTVVAASSLAPLDPCTDEVWLARHRSAKAPRAELSELGSRLWRAHALTAAGRYQEGLTLAREVLDATSETEDLRLRAEASWAAGSSAARMGAYEDAERLLSQAFDIALAAGEDDLALGAASRLVIMVGYRMAKHERGELWGVVAQGLHARVGAPGDLAEARLNNNLASVYLSQGRYPEAERAHERAIAAKEKALGPDHPEVATSYSNLGGIYWQQGHYEDAERAHRKALGVREQALGPLHPDVASSRVNLGTVLQSKGLYAEAERAYDEALVVREQTLPADHPAIATVHSNLGLVYQKQGRHQEAESSLEQALAMWTRSLAPDHPDLARAHANLATVYGATGRYAEAERAFEVMLDIGEKAWGRSHPDTARARGNLGNLYAVQGRYDDAERAYSAALAILEETVGSDHPDVATWLDKLSRVYVARHRGEEAEQVEQRAIAIWERAVGPDHPAIASGLVGLAEARLELGRTKQAIEAGERAVEIRTRHDTGPSVLGDATFVLARALWRAGQDRPRARALGEQARDAYRKAGDARTDELTAVEEWLAAR